MVQDRAILQWPSNRKSDMVYQTAPFSMNLNDTTQFSRSCHSLTRNIPQTAKDMATVAMKCE